VAKPPIILLTNDDGIHAAGLTHLAESLGTWGDLWVAAPDSERSATSHSLTLKSPIHVDWLDDRHISIHGTPADSVLLAVRRLMPTPPDIVVSGINHGPNLGDDVKYSGTVGAAMEATILKIPALAVSLADRSSRNFEAAAAVASSLAKRILETGLPEGCMLNVNVPNIAREDIRGVKVTRLGRRTYQDMVHEHPDGPDGTHFRIGDGFPVCEKTADTDCGAIEEGWITLTPLRLDMTDHDALGLFRGWDMHLPEVDRAGETKRDCQ